MAERKPEMAKGKPEMTERESDFIAMVSQVSYYSNSAAEVNSRKAWIW